MPSQRNTSRIPIQFLKSAALASQAPRDSVPEIALAGRSNAGKSSFLNSLNGGKAIAKVSAQPGKTRLLNFYDVRGRYRLVDMPGYGWASVSRKEMEGWQELIEGYLKSREQLVGVLLLMDVRRKWTEDEQQLVDWLSMYGRQSAVVLTKKDKLGHGASLQQKRSLETQTGLPCFLISSLKRQGLMELENFIYENWVRFYQPAEDDEDTEEESL